MVVSFASLVDESVSTYEYVEFVVAATQLDSVPDTVLAFRLGNTVSLHASGGDCAHFFVHEPHGSASLRVWEVRNDEEGQNGDRSARSRLQDEQPLPAVKTVDVAKSVEHAGSDQT